MSERDVVFAICHVTFIFAVKAVSVVFSIVDYRFLLWLLSSYNILEVESVSEDS